MDAASNSGNTLQGEASRFINAEEASRKLHSFRGVLYFGLVRAVLQGQDIMRIGEQGH